MLPEGTHLQGTHFPLNHDIHLDFTNWHHESRQDLVLVKPQHPLLRTLWDEPVTLRPRFWSMFLCVKLDFLVFGCWMMLGFCCFFLNYLLLQRWGYCWLKLCFLFFLSGWLISFQFWGKDSLRYVYIYIYLHMLLYSCLLYDNFSVVWTPSSLYSMCMQNFHLLILCCGDHPWGMQKTPQWRKEYPRSKSGGFGCYNMLQLFPSFCSCG